MITRVLKRNAPILSLTNYWEYDDYKGEENFKQFMYDLTSLFRPISKDGFTWNYDRATGNVYLYEGTSVQLTILENQIIVVDTSKKGIDAIFAYWLGEYQDLYQEENEHKKEILESFPVWDLLNEVKRRTKDLT